RHNRALSQTVLRRKRFRVSYSAPPFYAAARVAAAPRCCESLPYALQLAKAQWAPAQAGRKHFEK
ncbi:MAG: hypothetical protein SPK50_08880, partial [Mobiluncus porci]|uniref:hypothetical protein n=1 Tax=Mobiluncus porci TaxID=2652278 RepID=UPI0023F10E13